MTKRYYLQNCFRNPTHGHQTGWAVMNRLTGKLTDWFASRPAARGCADILNDPGRNTFRYARVVSCQGVATDALPPRFRFSGTSGIAVGRSVARRLHMRFISHTDIGWHTDHETCCVTITLRRGGRAGGGAPAEATVVVVLEHVRSS